MKTTTTDQKSEARALGISEAGVRLLTLLKGHNYSFITPTPTTHHRVLQSSKTEARDLRDVFGWSLPFSADLLPSGLLDSLQALGGLREDEAGFRSSFRVSTLGQDLFLHSAYPTSAEDAVFFGPDTYRFARFLRQVIGPTKIGRVIDIGAGSGAGAVVAQRIGHATSLILTDVNPAALEIARMNLASAGLTADVRLGSGLDAASEEADLIIANPPFIAGNGGRTYRDGGDMKGARLSLNWALAGAAQLAPQGRFVLYTGSAIVAGTDALHEALKAQLDGDRFDLSYDEIDPDIFGEQLSSEGYEDVERIAAVGAIISRR